MDTIRAQAGRSTPMLFGMLPVDHSSGPAKAGSGIKSSLLGTIRRSDNTTQVTYNGQPLYYYSGDSKPGQLNGEGVDAFGAKWYVVDPAGGKVEGASS